MEPPLKLMLEELPLDGGPGEWPRVVTRCDVSIWLCVDGRVGSARENEEPPFSNDELLACGVSKGVEWYDE